MSTKTPMTAQIPFVTICSVENKPFYKRLMLVAPTDEKPQPTGRATEYRIEGATDKNPYTLLRVYDGVSFPTRYDQTNNGTNPPAPPQPESALSIAGSLLDEWKGAGLHSRNLPRGIEIIQGDIPTQEELNMLNDRKWSRMRTLVMAADQRLAAGQSHDTLTREDVEAALALGEVRQWADPEKYMKKKRCPNCGNIINADAIGCSSCGKHLPDFYEEMGYSDAEIEQVDPAVMKAILRLRKVKQTPKPTINK